MCGVQATPHRFWVIFYIRRNFSYYKSMMVLTVFKDYIVAILLLELKDINLVFIILNSLWLLFGLFMGAAILPAQLVQLPVNFSRSPRR